MACVPANPAVYLQLAHLPDTETVSRGSSSLQDSSLMVQVEVASSTLDNVTNYARNLNQVQIEQPKPKRRG